jgi:hypothetical protein
MLCARNFINGPFFVVLIYVKIKFVQFLYKERICLLKSVFGFVYEGIIIIDCVHVVDAFLFYTFGRKKVICLKR